MGYSINNYFKLGLKKGLKRYFIYKTRKAKFCIISNDCWGGEVYKLLDREFNTPFIGLFLMGPCYIELLKNLKENIFKRLEFIDPKKSKYVEAIANLELYPIAILEGTSIEIHFLHYNDSLDAEMKWNRRLKRIDFGNIFIKYDCSKDFSDASTIREFSLLEFEHKLIFGNRSCKERNVFRCELYSNDAVKQFRNCFLSFDPIGWILGNANFKFINKYISLLAYKYL